MNLPRSHGEPTQVLHRVRASTLYVASHLGVLHALEEQNRINDVIVTGFRGEPDAFETIAEGRMEMIYVLKPYTWGNLSSETMLKHRDEEELPDLVPIETVLVDQDIIE